MSRFRSHGKELLHVTQSIAAHLLATNMFMHYRWIPSEWNPADGPSRNLLVASGLKPLVDRGNHASEKSGFGSSMGGGQCSGSKWWAPQRGQQQSQGREKFLDQ
eukprot:9649801-Karenia_brevis.AAC.1